MHYRRCSLWIHYGSQSVACWKVRMFVINTTALGSHKTIWLCELPIYQINTDPIPGEVQITLKDLMPGSLRTHQNILKGESATAVKNHCCVRMYVFMYVHRFTSEQTKQARDHTRVPYAKTLYINHSTNRWPKWKLRQCIVHRVWLHIHDF